MYWTIPWVLAMGWHRRYLLSWKNEVKEIKYLWNYDLLSEGFIGKCKPLLFHFYLEALRVTAPMREHAGVAMAHSMSTEMIEVPSWLSLWLAEQEWGLSHLSFNLSALVCFWKTKNCFIELSSDMSQSTAYAASYLLETPSH